MDDGARCCWHREYALKRENDDEDDEVAGDDEVDVHSGGTTHVSVGLPTLSFDFLPASHLSAMLYTLYVFTTFHNPPRPKV